MLGQCLLHLVALTHIRITINEEIMLLLLICTYNFIVVIELFLLQSIIINILNWINAANKCCGRQPLNVKHYDYHYTCFDSCNGITALLNYHFELPLIQRAKRFTDQIFFWNFLVHTIEKKIAYSWYFCYTIHYGYYIII